MLPLFPSSLIDGFAAINTGHTFWRTSLLPYPPGENANRLRAAISFLQRAPSNGGSKHKLIERHTVANIGTNLTYRDVAHQLEYIIYRLWFLDEWKCC